MEAMAFVGDAVYRSRRRRAALSSCPTAQRCSQRVSMLFKSFVITESMGAPLC